MVTVICKCCGKEFQAPTRKSKVCSDECRKIQKTKMDAEWFERKREKRYCVICEKEIHKPRTNQKTCSKECFEIHRKAYLQDRCQTNYNKPVKRRQSRIDEKEEAARNVGMHYADIQKAETLRMCRKIKV